MKRINKTGHAVLLFALLHLAQMASSQICQNFNDGTSTGWRTWNAAKTVVSTAPNADGTKYLRATDGTDQSWLYNTAINAQLLQCGSICFDYKIFDDALTGTNEDTAVTAIIRIFTGTISNQTTFAVFRLSTPIYEETPWMNICVPLHEVMPGSPLPGNAQGRWEMAGGSSATWNALVTSFAGVAFSVDVAGSGSIQEKIGIDNFCYTPGVCCVQNPSSLFTMTTACNNGNFSVTTTPSGPAVPNHWWGLYITSVEGSTADATTVDANPATPGLDPVQVITGPTATFSGLDLSKFYYIKHGIWQDGCFEWRESRLPVINFKATNIFNFEDAGGTAKTRFCYGENVYLDGTASLGENSYYIDAERRPIGSPGAFSWYAGLGWFSGEVGIVNLSQLFAGLNPAAYFEPGYEYRVKLALSNAPNCVAWTERTQVFTVECCDGFINPAFQLTTTPGNGNYAITASGFQIYPNPGIVHEWFVASSPTTSGPYTPVTQFTTTTQHPVTILANAEYGRYYTVIHRIKTPCGDYCYAEIIRRDLGAKTAVAATATDAPVNCALVDSIWPPVCPTPGNLMSDCRTGLLTWNAVANATSYLLEITFNDPACCKGAAPTAMRYTVTRNSFDIRSVPMPAYSCFSWKIATNCANGQQSAWSATQCFSCGFLRTGPTVKAVAEKTISPVTEPVIAPNPGNGLFNISMQAPGDLSISITVYNTYGKLVTSLPQQPVPGGRFTARLSLQGNAPGIYTMVIKTNFGVFNKKLVIQ